MSQHRDPDLIYQSERRGILSRFVTGAHIDAAEAERWLDAWERRAASVGVSSASPTYWSAGRRWIGEQMEPRDDAEA